MVVVVMVVLRVDDVVAVTLKRVLRILSSIGTLIMIVMLRREIDGKGRGGNLRRKSRE